MVKTKKSPNIGILGFYSSLGAVVEEVRTVFEKNNDITVYIPEFGVEPFV